MDISLTNDKKLVRLYRLRNLRRSFREILTFFLIIALVVSCVMIYLSDRVIEPDLKMRKDLPDLSDAEFIWNVDTSVFEKEVSAYKSSISEDVTRALINLLGFSEPRVLREDLKLKKGGATLWIDSYGVVRYTNEDARGFALTGDTLAEKRDEMMRLLGLDPADFVFDGKNGYDQVVGSYVFGFSGIAFYFKGDTLYSAVLSLRDLSHVVTTDSRSLEDCENYMKTDDNMTFRTEVSVDEVDKITVSSAEIRYSIDRNTNHVQPLYDLSGTLVGSLEGETVETAFEATIPALPDRNLRWSPWEAMRNWFNNKYVHVDHPTEA